MNKNIVYNFILIFIIIKCVKSQDNDPDQPSEDDDEEDEYNFEVSDVDEIIEEETGGLINPQYQPQYQQIEESQYPTQPQTQPQQYPGYLPESQGYQPEYQYYPGYQQQQQQYQTDTYGYYQPPAPTQQVPQQLDQYYDQYESTPQVPQHPDQYYQHYGPTTPIQPSQPQPQPQPQQQPSYQYYDPYNPTQPQQPEQYHEPSHPPQQPSYQYYEPPQPTQQPSYQHYEPSHPTQPQSTYQYYQPTTAPPPQPQVPQPQYQYYLPPPTQPQTTDDDENFYVTEHDQVHQVPSTGDPEFIYGPSQPPTQYPIPPQQTIGESTEQPIKPRKRATKRKDPRTPEKQGDEQPIKLKKPRYIKKTKHINFYKRGHLGMLVEMNESDYNVTHSDEDKTKYLFNANLEQIESDGEVVYEHLYGIPYCSSLTHSKRTNVIIITNIQGFILIKKTKGLWERTDANIPDYVTLFSEDSDGELMFLSKEHYNIIFTSNASFRYEMLPGVECHKIVVDGLVAWEKTEEDEGFPLVFYVTPKLTVKVNFEGYFKVFERRGSKYTRLFTKSSVGGSKYH
ncbi:SVSP family protein [Theileria parva strain Muguga]|uniref:Theileria-specific sub-telomeric protein, SVSP family n=1 Tax=Theileria parva TaxID=5875 RepID=Q4MYH0_THEPA|nr:SVSP family protein [Theileria parva strain Muguga]EAN30712.1 SVSP family protein [Theileria parva strain Muguga]|eukprot:XP_762995.1 hypothetical protein [Theileria parva strain Muguga]